MHFVKAIFSCILLFQAALCTVPLPTKTPSQQKQVTSGGSSSTGCGNVHVNNYCSGPDEEIKAQLLKIRTQLADIQQKVDSLTGNNSNSGKYNRINAFFWQTSNHILADLPKGNLSFCVKSYVEHPGFHKFRARAWGSLKIFIEHGLGDSVSQCIETLISRKASEVSESTFY